MHTLIRFGFSNIKKTGDAGFEIIFKRDVSFRLYGLGSGFSSFSNCLILKFSSFRSQTLLRICDGCFDGLEAYGCNGYYNGYNCCHDKYKWAYGYPVVILLQPTTYVIKSNGGCNDATY